MAEFPPRLDGSFYLTEGGTETELLYKHGLPLPEFAMFPLLEDAEGLAISRDMYRRYMEAAAAHGAGILLIGHDYRASPDWGTKLGYDPDALAAAQRRCIAFLAEIREEFRDRVEHAYIAGCLGPRGDAYGTGGSMTADEAEAYHLTQLETLKGTEADMAVALTFNNVPEAVGAVRAAGRVGLPIGVSLTLTLEGRLRSGPGLRESVEAIDAQTGGAAAWMGTNCSHPMEFFPALADEGPWLDRLRYFRPNAAQMDKLALCKLGHLEDGDPVELGGQMADLAARLPRADILGGCCGTDERHLGEIATAVMALDRPAPA